jgi:hypothetical protein
MDGRNIAASMPARKPHISLVGEVTDLLTLTQCRSIGGWVDSLGSKVDDLAVNPCVISGAMRLSGSRKVFFSATALRLGLSLMRCQKACVVE